MQQIYKTIFRELRFQKKRTFLSFLCIFVIVAFPLAMFSIEPSIDASVVESNQSYQLAYIDVRFQGNADEILTSVEALIESNPEYADISFDIRPTTNFQLYHASNWYYTSIVGVNTTEPPKVNQFISNQDISELQDGMAFILESFAKELEVEIGDTITLYTPSGEKEVEIAGFVKSIEFLSYDLALEGAIYLNYDTFQEYCDWDDIQFNSVTFYFQNNPDLDALKDFTEKLRDEVSPIEAQIFYSWYVREFSISSIFQDVLGLTSQILFIMACTIILAAGIVIYLITKRFAVEQRKQTGMLYAYGFPSKIILRVFMLRTLFLSIIAIMIGMIGSYGLLQIMVRIMISRWGIPTIITRLSPLALGVVPALVIITTQIFTFLACRSNVKMTPYEAIRGKIEFKIGKKKRKTQQNLEKDSKKLKKAKKTSFFPIQIKYPLRNISRNRKRGILITCAFIGAIAISFALIQTQTSITGTFTNYFDDQIHWDVQTRFDSFKSDADIELIFEDYAFIDSYEPYLHGDTEIPDQPEYGLNIRGLLPNSALYSIDLKEGALFSNDTAQEGIISSYSAKPLGLEVGDYFEFLLLGAEFRIKIVGIARDLDIPNSCFMLLPAIEETVGFSAINGALIQLDNEESLDSVDYENFLFELNENPEIQYAIEKETYENQMLQMINTQLFIVQVTIVLALMISFLIIFVTAFISIIERKREIALQRSFGFKKNQILVQIFIEMGILISLAVLFGILLGGEGLGRVLQFFIGKFFFKLDFVYFWGDYVSIIGFATGCVLLSTFPGINMLRKQNLATAIIE
ncbi:MAG: ABC transporter permease [Promethearchaeota archaeon]